MNEIQEYSPMQGIRATPVAGAEDLLRQGEYYVSDGRLIIKCPICRVDNLTPKSYEFKTANWLQRMLGIKKGLLTQKTQCWFCRHGFFVSNGEIWITNGPIKTQ